MTRGMTILAPHMGVNTVLNFQNTLLIPGVYVLSAGNYSLLQSAVVWSTRYTPETKFCFMLHQPSEVRILS
jgi:hypothetical protein